MISSGCIDGVGAAGTDEFEVVGLLLSLSCSVVVVVGGLALGPPILWSW